MRKLLQRCLVGRIPNPGRPGPVLGGLAVLVVLATTVSGSLGATALHPATGSRSLVVIADSIVLGAAQEIPASMPDRWNVTVDAEVARSTSAGLDAVRAQRAAITDTLVIGLGANDGGTPSVFRPRVEALLAEVADVPHVYWIDIAEVRSYYPGANQVIREAAAGYDNVEVISWNELALNDPGLTGSDGLHLTARGQQAMADTIVAVVTAPEPISPELAAKIVLYQLLVGVRSTLY